MNSGSHGAVDEPPPGPGEQRPGGSLTKVTINLVPKAMRALDEVSSTTGDTKTESINRAVQIYAWMQSRINAGERLVVLDKEGNPREIQIF